VACKHSFAPTQEEIKTLRDLKILHKHRIFVHLLLTDYWVFFSTEAGSYVHIFDLSWIIAAKRVNNAVVNYKNEYLKMKPAFAQPYQNHCSVT